MGEVIADYRSRRYPSQAGFATAAGVDKQTVAYWESNMYLSDLDRRVFLARMLKIPAALLGLNWRQVVYQDNTGTHTNPPLDYLAELLEEDTYYHYEDTLVMAWGWFYSGKLHAIADRFERRLRKLEEKVQSVPEHDKEAWKWLLSQYLNFYTLVIRHYRPSMEYKREVLCVNAKALKLATEIEDIELTALVLINRASLHEEQKHPAQTRVSALAAMDYANRLRVPLAGNIYLLVPSMLAPYAGSDETLVKEFRGWHDKALNMVWKAGENIEPDNSFMKLNLAGVHHERARLFLQLYQTHPVQGYLTDARNELKLAWEAFTPDIIEWASNFHMTEARIFQEEHDLQGSAQAGLAALKAARATQSKKQEALIQTLYYDLLKTDAGNPYVHNLGAELGIF